MKTFFAVCFAFFASLLMPSLEANYCFNAPRCCWTGVYVGAHGGYGWSSSETSIEPLPNAALFVNLAPTRQHLNPDGGFFGLQFGYNLLRRQLLMGIETDFSGGEVSATVKETPIIRNNGTPFPGTGFLKTSQNTDWFGTIRPRIGYIIRGNLLFFATGGFAYAHVKYHGTTNFQPIGTEEYHVSFSRVKGGWTLGAGLEYARCSSWSVKAEYLYYALGHVSQTVNPSSPMPPLQVQYTYETHNNLFRVGLNYFFHL